MKFLVTGYGWVPRKTLDKLPEHVLQSCVVDAELSIDEEDDKDSALEAARQLALLHLDISSKANVTVWDPMLNSWLHSQENNEGC